MVARFLALPEGRAANEPSRWEPARRRRLTPLVAFSGLVVAGFILAGLLAELLAPHDYAAQDLARRFSGPSIEIVSFHPLGTDHLGRDLLSRLLYGARVSLLVGVGAVALAALVGIPLGALAGYLGGLADPALMWLMDLIQAFPGLLLAIAIASALGPGLVNAALAIGLVGAPVFARLVRAAVLGSRSSGYVEAARALGAGLPRLLWSHLLPAATGVIVVRVTLALGTAVLAEAGLSFLGLGAQPPDPSWGNLLSDGRTYLRRAPALTVLPGLCIMATVLSLNLLGDALRDALDPHLP